MTALQLFTIAMLVFAYACLGVTCYYLRRLSRINRQLAELARRRPPINGRTHA